MGLEQCLIMKQIKKSTYKIVLTNLKFPPLIFSSETPQLNEVKLWLLSKMSNKFEFPALFPFPPPHLLLPPPELPIKENILVIIKYKFYHVM